MNYAKYGLAGLMMQRNQNELKNREMDLREQEIKSRDMNRQNMIRIRLEQMQNQHQAELDRFNLGNAQLAEREREFQEKLKSGFFKRGQQSALPVGYKYAMNAMQIAQDAGALNPDGTIDMSKLNPMQQALVRVGLQGAAKQVASPIALRQSALSPNILATFDQIDPQVLAHYAGPAGRLRFQHDQLQTMNGANIPIFNKYKIQRALVSEILPAQITQAYQGSVQPKAMENLTKALYNTDWSSNPDIVVSQLQQARELIEREYKNAQKQTGDLNSMIENDDGGNMNDSSGQNPRVQDYYLNMLGQGKHI